MSRHVLEAAGLRRSSWTVAASADRPPVRWWPTSVPDSDLAERQRTSRPARRPARRPLRRGRIQFVLA